MAQVVRKYLDGGKPTLIYIADKPYTVESIREKANKNLDIYLKNKGLGDETKEVISNYYGYLFPAMERGEITYSTDRNRAFNVAEPWASDGTFNQSGHGLLRHDITNDKTAGINFGTDLIYDLIEDGIITEYIPPAKKNIELNSALELKLLDKYFGGNAKAYKEGWKNSSVDARKLMIYDAMSELEFDADLYNNVDLFNQNKSKFLQILSGDLTDEVYNSFNTLGGYGLKKLLGLESDTTESTEDGTTAKTWDDYREDLRKQGIELGITADNLEDYVESKIRELKQLQGVYKEQNDRYANYNTLTNAYNGYLEFGKALKDSWYMSYGSTPGLSFNYDNNDLDDLSGLSQDLYYQALDSLRLGLKEAGEAFKNKQAVPNIGKLVYSIVNEAGRRKYLRGAGEWKAIVGSENWDDYTIIAFNPSTKGIRIMSMADFPEIYNNNLKGRYIKKYNETNGTTLSENFDLELALLIQQILAEKQLEESQQVTQNKKGGIIKAVQGTYLAPEAQIGYQKTQQPSTTNNTKTAQETSRKFRKVEMTPYQVARLVGLAGDVAMTVGAFTGSAINPLTYAGGITSIGGHTVSDFLDPEISSSQAVLNILGTTALAGIRFIPVIGTFASAAKAINTVKQIAPWLISSIAVIGTAPNAVKALKKAVDPKTEELSYDDWKDIGMGLSALLATVSAVGVRRQLKSAKSAELEASNTSNGSESSPTLPASEALPTTLPTATPTALPSTAAAGATGGAAATTSTPAPTINPAPTSTPTTTIAPTTNPAFVATNEYTLFNPSVSGSYPLQVKPTQTFNVVLHAANRSRGAEGARIGRERAAVRDKARLSEEEKLRQLFRERARLARETKIYTNVFTNNRIKDSIKKYMRMYNGDLEAFKRAFQTDLRTFLLGRGVSPKDIDAITPQILKNVNDTYKLWWKEVERLRNWDKSFEPIPPRPSTEKKPTIVIEDLIDGGSNDASPFKQGGFITNVLNKYYSGGLIPKFANSGQFRNITSTSNWYNDIFTPYFDKMLELIGTLKDDDLDAWIKDTNSYQTRHRNLFKDYDPTQPLQYNENIRTYQNDIATNRSFVNELGITNGWKKSRYSREYNGTQGDGILLDDGTYAFSPDGLGGAETYDRRILGKANDFTAEQLKTTQDRLREKGLELYEDDGYMLLRKLTNVADNTTDSTPEGYTPTLGEDGQQLYENGLPVYTDEDGNRVTIDPKTGKSIAVGSGTYNKAWLKKATDIVTEGLKKVNYADVLDTFRALRVNAANKKATDTEIDGIHATLKTPNYEYDILKGAYPQKQAGVNYAGTFMTMRPVSSDSKLDRSLRAENYRKGLDSMQKADLADWSAKQLSMSALQTIANKNSAYSVATANDNLAAINASIAGKAALRANEIKQSGKTMEELLKGFSQRMRDSYALKNQQMINAENDRAALWYKQELANLSRQKDDYYRAELAKAKLDPNFNYSEWYTTFERSAQARAFEDLMLELNRQYKEQIINRTSPFITYTPGVKPSIETSVTPYIMKKGGSLSFEERAALKRLDHTYKSIRQAQRETNKSSSDIRKQDSAALREMAKLTADLVKKAIGIK